jgi:hypothetical protein
VLELAGQQQQARVLGQRRDRDIGTDTTLVSSK